MRINKSKGEIARRSLRLATYYDNLWEFNRKSTAWRVAYFGARSIATTQYQRHGKKVKMTTAQNKELIAYQYWQLKGQ